jgi:hypothetical protein
MNKVNIVADVIESVSFSCIYMCGTSYVIRTARIWYIADAHRVTGKFFSVEVLIA